MEIHSGSIAVRGSAHHRIEDAILVDDALGLYAVADGVTIPAGGAEASGLAVELLRRFYPENRDLERSLRRVHAEVLRERELRARTRAPFIGYSTLTAVVLDRDGYRLVHVGDSAALLCRDGRVRVLTPQHHDGRGALTQCVGMEEEFAPHAAGGGLRPGDHLVLATDGVTACVDADSIAAATVRHREPKRIAERLIAAASVAPVYDDDKSVVVLYVERM